MFYGNEETGLKENGEVKQTIVEGWAHLKGLERDEEEAIEGKCSHVRESIVEDGGNSR